MLAPTLPANTLQGMMQLCCDALVDEGNTFYSSRVYDLFPQMATANSGWSTNANDSNQVFGSIVITDAANDSDYIEWTVYVPAGNYKVSILDARYSNRGKSDLTIDGGAVVDTYDSYNATLLYNQKWTSAQFTITEGSHTIRLTKNGKNASSSSYIVGFTHAQLVKQDAGSALASVSNIPHTIDVPIVFADSHSGWNTLIINSSQMFGTHVASAAAQNDEITFSFWAPKGDFTLALLHRTTTGAGIATVYIDGSSIGTIDTYGANAYNILDTSLTGTFASTGIHTIRFVMASKNASSSSYGGYIQHIQIRMTSITEPVSQDLAPEVALLWPVFNEGNTLWSGLSISSSQAYYSYNTTGGNGLNAEMTLSSNLVLRPGTYRLDIHGLTGAAYGIYHALIDSVDLGTVDGYHASGGYNKLLSIASLVMAGFSPHTLKLKMATKNASATQYHGYITLARLIRTGS